jgi:hypothetical protein
MFTVATGPERKRLTPKWMPTKDVRLAALLGALVLLSIAVNTFAIVADSKLRHPSRPERDCSATSAEAERSLCYGTLADRPPTH